MRILVNAHEIILTDEPVVNYGEYNTQKFYFEFSEEYDGLIKDAIFTDSKSSYRISLEQDDSCDIPYEITSNDGLEYVKLGVYAYDVGANDVLINRYSPSPVYFKIENGSYRVAREDEIPSADLIEQYEKRLDDGLREVNEKLDDIDVALENVNTAITETNNLDIDVNKSGKDTTIDITKKDGTHKQETVHDGYNLDFDWRGTELGVKREDEQQYEYTDLKGEKGDCYFATFSIVGAHLIMNKPDELTQFNFHLDEKGHLQMEVGI